MIAYSEVVSCSLFDASSSISRGVPSVPDLSKRTCFTSRFQFPRSVFVSTRFRASDVAVGYIHICLYNIYIYIYVYIDLFFS